MARGIYTLLLERTADGSVAVGALGPVEFPAGWYAYTGSAVGPGGFQRVDRHGAVAAGERDVRHWHVDYLLGDDATRMDGAVRSAGVDAECAVADRIADAVEGGAVAEFGASDCDCPSHLARDADRERLVAAVERAHGESGTQAD